MVPHEKNLFCYIPFITIVIIIIFLLLLLLFYFTIVIKPFLYIKKRAGDKYNPRKDK